MDSGSGTLQPASSHLVRITDLVQLLVLSGESTGGMSPGISLKETAKDGW